MTGESFPKFSNKNRSTPEITGCSTVLGIEILEFEVCFLSGPTVAAAADINLLRIDILCVTQKPKNELQTQ